MSVRSNTSGDIESTFMFYIVSLSLMRLAYSSSDESVLDTCFRSLSVVLTSIFSRVSIIY